MTIPPISHKQPTHAGCPVSREEVGTEGGAIYRVTFEDVSNPGDVSLLIPHPEGLTGTGAAVVSREVVKGSEAVGSAVRVGFSAPQQCSTSHVRQLRWLGSTGVRKNNHRSEHNHTRLHGED